MKIRKSTSAAFITSDPRSAHKNYAKFAEHLGWLVYDRVHLPSLSVLSEAGT